MRDSPPLKSTFAGMHPCPPQFIDTTTDTREMFDRYNTVDDDDTRLAVDQMQAWLGNVDHSVDQKRNII